MKNLSIDIESYSSVNLAKSGVYRYAEAPDFEVLLFGYSADGAPVKVVDLTAGETLPADVRSALTDPAVTKWAFNAQFERVCLSRYLGYPTGQYLDPSSWHCTMVWAATLGLPLSLEGVGAVLGLEKQKLKEGKDLIRYFCTPAKARDGSLIRHYPTDAPEKWSLFKAYNLRDVETEMSIQQKLSKCPVTESEWRNYTLDQQINDRGIMLDRTLVTQAIRCDERFKRTHMEQARSVTGLDICAFSPGSRSLSIWDTTFAGSIASSGGRFPKFGCQVPQHAMKSHYKTQDSCGILRIEIRSRTAIAEKFRNGCFYIRRRDRCPENRCAPALTPAAPTSVKDSFVNSTVWKNAESTTNTSAAPMSTASTAERGNASVTAMRRSIPSVRCV